MQCIIFCLEQLTMHFSTNICHFNRLHCTQHMFSYPMNYLTNSKGHNAFILNSSTMEGAVQFAWMMFSVMHSESWAWAYYPVAMTLYMLACLNAQWNFHVHMRCRCLSFIIPAIIYSSIGFHAKKVEKMDTILSCYQSRPLCQLTRRMHTKTLCNF